MRVSLRAKTCILIVLIALVLSVAAIIVSDQAIRQIVDDTYRNRANDLSKTVAVVVDSEKAASLKAAILEIYNASENKVTSDDWGSAAFNAYMAQYAEIEQSEDFLYLREQLRSIQDVNDVDCIYLEMVDDKDLLVIYLVDGAYEDACPPGCIDPLYEQNFEVLENPDRGFPPYITDTEQYGSLVTAGAPVYDDGGHVICYATVDISMDVIRAQQAEYVRAHSLLLALLTLIVSVIAILLVNRSIIRPINRLSSAAAHFSAGREDRSELDRLQIRSRDEIQSLYDSIQLMVKDIQGYIDNLMKTTQELTQTRIEADAMGELANKDALTGVGSKLAYDHQVAMLSDEIRRGDARFGIVMVDMNDLKKLNDNYGHEKGNVAIRKTCALICDVFVHSPVYRFGGDEFVVVIKDRDYENIDDLLLRFNEASEASEGEPWEKINAAIGYALYNGDETVDDVFRKADRIMYEHKKEMKARSSD